MKRRGRRAAVAAGLVLAALLGAGCATRGTGRVDQMHQNATPTAPATSTGAP